MKDPGEFEVEVVRSLIQLVIVLIGLLAGSKLTKGGRK